MSQGTLCLRFIYGCSFEGLLIECETDTSYGVLSLKIEENILF
jgi:hypothetical protein